MHVTSVSIRTTGYDHTRHGTIGYVDFDHACPRTGETGSVHFLCIAKLPENSPYPLIERALLDEACRQVNFMPEYRLGQKTLTFASQGQHRASA